MWLVLVAVAVAAVHLWLLARSSGAWSNPVTLLEPLWLLLALPLFAVLLRYPLSGWLLNVLRGTDHPAGRPRSPGCRSASPVVPERSWLSWTAAAPMPENSDADHKEPIDLLHSSMGRNDQLAVVSFGQAVAVEPRPGQRQVCGFHARSWPGWFHAGRRY